ncbi:MAG: hypothetical protein ACXVRK_12680 [Gaiellaceae bacterium]
MTHPATSPLTLHERELAAHLLSRGWGVASVARVLQHRRVGIYGFRAA